ncbi:MAG TPA: CpsD/CapB family tyrosine-protein kinase [Terriglobales bacterium]|jgi:Mrp family chromosome partitioning ATPase|nr:CpsD/CapB family tyrosine-protein kinase [Terriglobales bacterium]
MSRNFELLNQVGKGQVLLTKEVAPTNVPVPEVFAPSLEIDGMAREEITKLVHRVFLLGGPEAPRRVVFTGTESGNGTTWMCAHAGEILASQTARTVCIVDCNLRRPCLHDQFKVQNHNGLADALRGDGPVRQYSRQMRRNLWIVSCGSECEPSADLLTSDRMKMRLTELANEFDYLLLDVASLNTSNHGIVLGNLVDGMVIVLKAHHTRRDTTRDVIQSIQGANVRVLGAVLNQRTFPIPENIYKRI